MLTVKNLYLSTVNSKQHREPQASPNASTPADPSALTNDGQAFLTFRLDNASASYVRNVWQRSDGLLVVDAIPEDPTQVVDMVVIRDLDFTPQETNPVTPTVSDLLPQVESPDVSLDCTDYLFSDDESFGNKIRDPTGKSSDPPTPENPIDTDDMTSDSTKYPPGFGGMILMVSENEPLIPNETEA